MFLKSLLKNLNGKPQWLKNLLFSLLGFGVGASLILLINPGNIRGKALNAIGLSDTTMSSGVETQKDAPLAAINGSIADNTESSSSSSTQKPSIRNANKNNNAGTSTSTSSASGTDTTGDYSPSSQPSQPISKCIVYTDNGTVPCPQTLPSSFGSEGGACNINASANTAPCPAYSELLYINPLTRNGVPMCEFMWEGQVYKDITQPGTAFPTCI